MKLNRLIRVACLPVLAFIFVVGWTMYVCGKISESRKTRHKHVKRQRSN